MSNNDNSEYKNVQTNTNTYRLVEYRKISCLPLLPDAVVFPLPLPSVSLRVVPVQVPYSPHPQLEKEQCPLSKTIFTGHCPS